MSRQSTKFREEEEGEDDGYLPYVLWPKYKLNERLGI